MSNEALTWAFAQSIRNAGRKFVLVALADKADEAHSCWPSQATLAAMTGQSDRSVREHLTWLEEKGYVSRTQRRAQGKRTSDRYVLAVNVTIASHQQPLLAKSASSSSEPEDLAAPQPEESVVLPEDLAKATGESRQVTLNEPTREPSEKATADADASAPTINRRAQLLAKDFYDLRPMSNFPAVMEICKKAINAGHTDEAILDALHRVARDGRSLTVEVLRVELEGAGVRSTPQNRAPLTARELVERDRQRQRMMG